MDILAEALGLDPLELRLRNMVREGDEGPTGQQVATLRDDVLARFDRLYRRLERLEQEYQVIVQALRRIEVGLADEQRRHEMLERALARLCENVAMLTARIDEVERRLQG
jgi:CO/xanthine dehydrogenase Mo-binding subunit